MNEFRVLKRDVVPFARNLNDKFEADALDARIQGWVADGAIVCLDCTAVRKPSVKSAVAKVVKRVTRRKK